MSEREYKHPADVLQDAVCTSMDTPLRILEYKRPGLTFRAELSTNGAERLDWRESRHRTIRACCAVARARQYLCRRLGMRTEIEGTKLTVKPAFLCTFPSS